MSESKNPSKRSSGRKRRKRKMKSKIDSFSKGVGLSPARIAGLFLMLGLMGYFVYSIAVNDRQEDSDQEVVISEDKAQKIELTADQKLEELSRINNSPGENFLLTIERMAEAERLLVEVESGIEPTKVQSELIDEIRIRNKSVTVAAMMSNKISCDAEKVDLLNFCMSRIDSEVPAMRESCRFWLCSVPALDFAFDPSDAKLQGFLNAMRKYPDGYLSSPDKASVLGGLVVSMHSQGPVKREFAKKSYIPIAEQFAKSELPQVRSLSEKLKEHSIFGDFGLPTLEHRILWSDPTAESDLAGAFDALSQVGYVKPETWLTLIRAYERFLAVDKIEEAGEAWQKMWSYSEKLKGIKGVDGIQKVLNRQRTRAMFFGKPFDVAGNSVPNNEPIDATHQEYYAIIFLDRGRSSLEFLIRLGKVTRDKQMKFLPILAFEKELSKADFDSLSSVPKDITIADHETSQKYFRAFPADFFPYVLLVNRKGEVVSVNVDVEQVDTRIAKFELDKKRQRLESIGDPNPTSAGSR